MEDFKQVYFYKLNNDFLVDYDGKSIAEHNGKPIEVLLPDGTIIKGTLEFISSKHVTKDTKEPYLFQTATVDYNFHGVLVRIKLNQCKIKIIKKPLLRCVK